MITKGNVDDGKPLRFKQFITKLYGKLFGDKGYISKELFAELFSNGVHLITKLKKNETLEKSLQFYLVSFFTWNFDF